MTNVKCSTFQFSDMSGNQFPFDFYQHWNMLCDFFAQGEVRGSKEKEIQVSVSKKRSLK